LVLSRRDRGAPPFAAARALGRRQLRPRRPPGAGARRRLASLPRLRRVARPAGEGAASGAADRPAHCSRARGSDARSRCGRRRGDVPRPSGDARVRAAPPLIGRTPPGAALRVPQREAPEQLDTGTVVGTRGTAAQELVLPPPVEDERDLARLPGVGDRVGARVEAADHEPAPRGDGPPQLGREPGGRSVELAGSGEPPRRVVLPYEAEDAHLDEPHGAARGGAVGNRPSLGRVEHEAVASNLLPVGVSCTPAACKDEGYADEQFALYDPRKGAV